MNDKNGDKSYDNMPYETPKGTVSSNVIKDENTKSINFLSPNRFRRLRNYDTQDTNTSNTVTSPHNLNTARKDELPHKNLTVTRNPSDRKSKSNINMAPVTTIIGDSMVRKVFGDTLSNSLNNNHRVVVGSFGGAETQCMEDYIKPTIKLSPDQIIIHCGTNNLPSNGEPKTSTDNIINLAKKAKSDVSKVAMSGTIPGRDRHNQKAKQVNDILKQPFVDEDIAFISHHGIDPRLNLNGLGLQLNDKRSSRLANNFVNIFICSGVRVTYVKRMTSQILKILLGILAH